MSSFKVFSSVLLLCLCFSANAQSTAQKRAVARFAALLNKGGVGPKTPSPISPTERDQMWCQTYPSAFELVHNHVGEVDLADGTVVTAKVGKNAVISWTSLRSATIIETATGFRISCAEPRIKMSQSVTVLGLSGKKVRPIKGNTRSISFDFKLKHLAPNSRQKFPALMVQYMQAIAKAK